MSSKLMKDFAPLGASLFVTLGGVVAMRYYSDTDNKVADRTSRLNYATFVTYFFGIAPLVYFMFTMFGDKVSSTMRARAPLIFLIIASLFTWIMSAVVISDINKDKDEKHAKTKGYLGFILFATLVSFIGLSVMAYDPSKFKMF